jgi:hypothetical protein
MSDRFRSNPSVMKVARDNLNYVEGPNNDTKFGRWYGMNNAAWCAMFVSYCHWFGGAKIPPLQNSKGSAWCPHYVDHAQKTGQWRAKSSGYSPKPGDLILFQMRNRPDHIGIVEAQYHDGSIQTIEGNTDGSGSREGTMVARKRRRTKIIGYVAVDDDATLAQLRRFYAGLLLPQIQSLPIPVQGGSPASAVESVQGALNLIMGSTLATDGQFGPATFLTVAAFQTNCRRLGLKVTDPTGVVGASTKWWMAAALQNIISSRA